jgi:hypothetical protein
MKMSKPGKSPASTLRVFVFSFLLVFLLVAGAALLSRFQRRNPIPAPGLR